MAFIAREEELQDLQALYRTPSFQLAILYGRRRVGKTALVLESLRQSQLPYVYFQCLDSPEKTNAFHLGEALRKTLFPELMDSESVEPLLRYAFLRAADKPFILVLDEYPFLKKHVEGIDSMLQSLIQTYQSKSPLKLLILGSYIASMKESAGGQGAPLRGRANLIIDLKALSFRDAARFFPERLPEEKAALYALFGGIPYYLAAITKGLSVEEEIKTLILKERGPLSNEADFVLTEIGGNPNASEVFSAISAGAHRFGEILSRTSFHSSAALSWALKSLMDMELIRRELPLNQRQDSREARYSIADPFLSFYYTYLFPNLSALPIFKPDGFYQAFIAQGFHHDFVPRSFETLAQDYLAYENREGKIQPPFIALGRGVYHNKEARVNGEFDVVGEKKDGFVYFECKYENDPLSVGEMTHLEEQLKKASLPYTSLGFFVKTECSKEAASYSQQKGYQVITLQEIYAD